MRVPFKWLRDYLDPGMPPEALALKLTMAGLEVAKLERAGGEWAGVTIAKVISVQPHPNADRLRLATVDLGQRQMTVVCGAPNLQAGQVVAFASAGAELVDPQTGQTFALKPARIRGVLSEGMICSEKELCISDDRDGIMVLSPDAPVGVALEDYLGDTVMDVEVTPNRPDCLSVIGISREAAAQTGRTVTLPTTSYPPSQIADRISVTIPDPSLCARYCAAIIEGVRIGPSPLWMQRRLIQCGMRPISNVVDITNYVMLEYGQPLHAFDFDRLRGATIVVRRASEGEKITSLDGVERSLTGETLVIADAERPVAIAGIMGGATSEVTTGTKTILLESASFNQTSIRRTAARLNMRTEASVRFERGLSAGLAFHAAIRATGLFVELAGASSATEVLDVYPGRKEGQPIPFDSRDVKRVLGLDLDLGAIGEALALLGFECQAGRGNLLVSVPYWRSDIQMKADLAEEVARILGYDRVPSVTLRGEIPHRSPQPMLDLKARLRELMVGAGFNEVLTYSAVSQRLLGVACPDSPATRAALRLANPMSPEQEYLRTSLRPGVLSTLAANQRYEKGGIRLFELGKVYLPAGESLPDERETLCAVVCGRRSGPGRWLEGDSNMDFFDLKAVAETAMAGLGITVGYELAADPGLDAASSARLVVDGTAIGTLGVIEGRVASAFDISGAAYLLELDLGRILPFTGRKQKFSALPRFPGVARDIAVEVDKHIPAQAVEEVISGFPLVSRVSPFDCYMGTGVTPGKKSLAFSLYYLSPERTLTEEEVNTVQEKVLERLRQVLGARLRTS